MNQPAAQQPSPRAGDSFDRVIDALSRSGRRIKSSPRRHDVMAQCSMHEPDRNPSLHVTWDADGGKTSLWCFSCRVDETDLAEAVGLTGQDLWDEPATAQTHHPHVVQSEDTVVVYDTDPDDETLREALKQCHFRWDPERRRWSLPEHWKATTRTGKITTLLRILKQAGRSPLPVQRVDTAADVDSAAPRKGRSTLQRRAGKRWGKLGPLPAMIPAKGETEAPAAPEHAAADWRTIESYEYRDDNGVVIHRVTRQECICPERHKTLPQTYRVPGTDTWVDKVADAPGFVSVLYRQPEVRAANGRIVLLCEGEKDVDAVVAAGWDMVPTTNPGGSANFQAQHAEVLRGAGEVWVVLDRDDAGYQRGVRVSQLLAEADVGEVRFFLPAVVDNKADVHDHIAAGYSVDALDEVSVEEVTAWCELATARQWADKVLQAAGQVRAQLEAVEGADEVAAQAAQRHAVRWTAQAEMWLERVGEAVDRVVLADAAVATVWSGQAATIAEDKRSRSTHQVVRAFQMVGLAVPDHLGSPAEVTPVGDPAQSAADPVPDTVAVDAVSEPRQAVTPPPPVGLRIQRNRYRLDEDGIWELRTGKDPDAPDAWALLLNLDLRITAWEVTEAEDEVDDGEARPIGIDRSQTGVATVPTVVAVRVCWTNQRSGEIQHARIEYEDFKAFDWLSGLGLSVETGSELNSRGKARLYSAMLALYGDVGQTVLHRATGWRHEPDGSGSYFVHAAGAIGPDGPRSAEIDLDHELSRYALPEPTDSPELLRTAFLDYSAGLLTRIPARIAAPVLGAVYRSAIGHNPWVLGLIGPPGTYKTAVAAIAMHHWGQEFQDGRASVSKRPGSDTDNSVQFKTHAAKDTLFWADDFTKVSGVNRARQQLEDFIGLVHNRVGRTRMRRDSEGIKPGRPPRGSGLVTSELMPSSGSSSYQRLFPVPMVDSTREFLEPIKPFSHEDSRFQRNVLMASLVQWLTTRLDDCRLRAAAAMDEWAGTLMEHGHDVRLSQAVGSTYAGWVVMTDFLIDVGAVTGSERDVLLSRVKIALREAAGMAVDPDNPAHLGPRIVEMLRHTVTSAAHVVDSTTGAAPDWPLAARLGWTRTPMRAGAMGAENEYRYDKIGDQLGYLLYDKTGAPTAVGFEKIALDEALKAASSRASDGPQIDRVTAQQELAAAGAIVTETNGDKRKCTVKRVLPFLGNAVTRAPTRSLIVMPLDRLFDDHGDGDDGDDAPPIGWGDGPLPDLVGDDGGVPERGSGTSNDSPSEEDSMPQTPHTGQESAGTAESDSSEDAIEVGDFVDRDGIATPAVLREQTAACLACGTECGFWFGDLAVHPACWEMSTANRRRERLNQPSSRGTRTSVEPDTAPTQHRTPPAKKPTPKATTTTERTQVAVVDVDGVVLPDGSTRSLPEPCTHLGHLGHLAHDLDLGIAVNSWRDKQTKELIEHRTGGTLVVTDALAAQLGVDLSELDVDDEDANERIGEMTADHPMVTGALADGWNLGKPGDRMHKWTRMWADQTDDRGARMSVSFVFRRAVDPTFLRGDPDHATLAQRFQRYAAALGEPFYMSPHTTGLELLRRVRWAERKEILAPLNREDLPPPALMGGLIADLNWSRRPMEHELRMPYVMAFDRGGSYVPPASNLNLGLGQWTHHPDGMAGSSDDLDVRVPGYHRIRVPEAGDSRLPYILDPAGRGEQETWVMTPQLDMARSLGYQVDILESYTWSQYKRVLEPWYKRVRDARTTFLPKDPEHPDPEDEILKDAVKDLYKVFVGHLAHFKPHDPDKRREGYAPHWRHSIVAKADHNIVYMINKIGTATDQWPLAVSRDSIIYAVDSLDPKQAWPGDQDRYGTGLGQYDFDGVAHMAEHREFFTGKKYAGKKHLLTLKELPEAPGGGST